MFSLLLYAEVMFKKKKNEITYILSHLDMEFKFLFVNPKSNWWRKGNKQKSYLFDGINHLKLALQT